MVAVAVVAEDEAPGGLGRGDGGSYSRRERRAHFDSCPPTLEFDVDVTGVEKPRHPGMDGG